MLTQRLQESHQNSSLLVTFFDLFCCFCFMITMGNCEFCLSWITFPPSFSSSSSMRSTKETVWSQNVFQDELSLPLKLLSIFWLFPGELVSFLKKRNLLSLSTPPPPNSDIPPPEKDSTREGSCGTVQWYGRGMAKRWSTINLDSNKMTKQEVPYFLLCPPISPPTCSNPGKYWK